MSACACDWAPNITDGVVVSMSWMPCGDHTLTALPHIELTATEFDATETDPL